MKPNASLQAKQTPANKHPSHILSTPTTLSNTKNKKNQNRYQIKRRKEKRKRKLKTN